jgi:CheY-like chemotaxis protein
MAHILIVEDNPLNLKLATVILKGAGYDVATAMDAGEAEESIRDQLPDLILMDLGLPGKDGYALTREIRGRASTGHVPVLAVTSFAMKGDEEKAREAGCSGYLTKPIHREELLRQVRALLGRVPVGRAAGRTGT